MEVYLVGEGREVESSMEERPSWVREELLPPLGEGGSLVIRSSGSQAA